MDKYEYKVRSEEIKDLISKKKYAEAMKIADVIDWRRVKSVNMLCTISDLYKLNRRFEESREILLLAYERHPGSRMIVYSLCELSIKLDDVVQAVEYYKEFVQIAPRDNGRYILQYKLYEAQEVSLEERIAVLEELKRREYREKWAYELAYLYHRIGLSTKCIEECDELILWFGEGKYVTKAMELKMLHTELSGEQLEKYSKAKGTAAPVKLPSPQELDFEVPPINVGEYATINLQKEIAEGVKEVLGEGTADGRAASETGHMYADTDEIRNFAEFEDADAEIEPEAETKAALYAATERNQEPHEVEIEEAGDFTKEIITGLLQETPEEPEAEEIFFEDTDTMELPQVEEALQEADVHIKRTMSVAVKEDAPKQEEEVRVVRMSNTGEIPKIVQNVRPAVNIPSAESMAKEKNENFDNLLAQEYDGQISLAVPKDEPVVEKQITGQMSIEDILLEWEKMKKENEEKRAEAIRQRVKEQTGEIFSQFNASTKQGILAELDALAEDSIEKEKQGAMSREQTKEADAQISEAEDKAENKAENEALNEALDKGSNEESKAENEVSKVQNEVSEETAEAEKRASKETSDIGKEAAAAETKKSIEEKTEAGDAAEKEQTQKTERAMTPEEKKLFGSFIQTKTTKRQIIEALDNISLASYTGNLILTGEAGMGAVKLAKNIIKDIQLTDSNFSGRMAKISGQALNNKDLEKTFEKLSNGALIIEGAGGLKAATIKSMTKLLEQEKQGIIIILEDTKINMNKLLDSYQMLHQNFNLRIDIEAMDNDTLVLFGKKYAQEREYAIDELGVLALYTRISELQTSEHSVTTREVKEIVEEAICHADKKNIGHFMDILLRKRYDDEDMIILREKDFV